MTLYPAILDYIREEIPKTFAEIAKRSTISKKLQENTSILENNINCEIAKSRLLIDKVYELEGETISDRDIDEIISGINKIEKLYHKVNIENEKILSARKEYFKAYIEFYQQVIQQENNAYSLVGAIRMQFKTKDAFKKALEHVMQSEKKLCDVLVELQPAFAEITQATLEASEVIAEKRANEIFPEG